MPFRIERRYCPYSYIIAIRINHPIVNFNDIKPIVTSVYAYVSETIIYHVRVSYHINVFCTFLIRAGYTYKETSTPLPCAAPGVPLRGI